MRRYEISFIVLLFMVLGYSQESDLSSENKIDKKSYYEKRGQEDAKFEQQFVDDSEAESEDFWEEQKDYEEGLKKRDRKAYRAYQKGKRDAYREHYEHCNSHCHHSDHYYRHATFYYYGYHDYRYYRYPRRSMSTSVRVGTPSVRLGIL
jgi:hypothetical protein